MSMIRHLLSLMPRAALVYDGDNDRSSTPSRGVSMLLFLISSILGPWYIST